MDEKQRDEKQRDEKQREVPKFGHLTVNDLDGKYMSSVWIDTEHEWTPEERAALMYELFLRAFDCFVGVDGVSEDVSKAYGYARFMLDHIGENLSDAHTRIVKQAYQDALNKQVRL